MMKYHEIHRELGLHMEEDIANIPSKDLFPTLSMLEANGLEFNPEHNIGPITLNHNFLTHNEARQLIAEILKIDKDEMAADDDLTDAFPRRLE